MLFRRKNKKIDNKVNPVVNTEQAVKKYPIEDLSVAFICDVSYFKYDRLYLIPPHLEVLREETGKYGDKRFYSIKSGENISIRPQDCLYPSCSIGQSVLVAKTSLEYYLKNNNKRYLTKADIFYIQRQLNCINNTTFAEADIDCDYMIELLKSTKLANLKLPEEPKKENTNFKTSNNNISNGFLLELKKVMDKIDPNMSEESKKEYQIKLSNIGNEYINSIIENYSSIKLNPSLELEILKEYLKKLCALEEEIVKLNYRSNLENEIEQIKKYEMKKDNN